MNRTSWLFSQSPRLGSPRRWIWFLLLCVSLPLAAHVVPPEKLHPVAESYRRAAFVLGLNPVPWQQVAGDLEVVARGLAEVAPSEAEVFRAAVGARLAPFTTPPDKDTEPPTPEERQAAARELFESSTRAVARTLTLRLEAARAHLDDYRRAARELGEARQLWGAFEHEIRSADAPAFEIMGHCWLEMNGALGSPGILGIGAMAPDPGVFAEESAEVLAYLAANYSDGFAASGPRLTPLPVRSPSYDPGAVGPARLPPGADINKQLPRPRQILHMAERGVDESETPLIALGDMAFDSPMIFGEPARSLGVSCNTCHNKGTTNPKVFIPGLSAAAGSVDVSNSYFGGHANNGHLDPLDIPDLRGLRFTAPYGRNGRFESLREFSRNVIVNEFDGPEPDPLLLDGLVAYMLEFDFLPNPWLRADGRLKDAAPPAARRGESIFHRRFESMGGRSCADCHVPSDMFLDRRRHDIGSVRGAAADSLDRHLDTPTLLGARYTAPYFHDGSLPTLRAVSEWFDRRFDLALGEAGLADLTAYLEAVGEGVEAYEDTVHTLDAEMEEFSFFLSAYEFLESKGKPGLARTTFQTIAFEIRAHKWDVQDPAHLPVLDRLAELMDAADEASRRQDVEEVRRTIAAYRDLYREKAEVLR